MGRAAALHQRVAEPARRAGAAPASSPSCIELELDVEPLRREAARFEEKISALVAADPELTEYVRQLKRREFAQ